MIYFVFCYWLFAVFDFLLLYVIYSITRIYLLCHWIKSIQLSAPAKSCPICTPTDIREFYEVTLLNSQKSCEQKLEEINHMADKWEKNVSIQNSACLREEVSLWSCADQSGKTSHSSNVWINGAKVISREMTWKQQQW